MAPSFKASQHEAAIRIRWRIHLAKAAKSVLTAVAEQKRLDGEPARKKVKSVALRRDVEADHALASAGGAVLNADHMAVPGAA